MLSNKQKQLNLLGLATRSNRLISGEERVLNELKHRKVSLVVIATDLSEKTAKKISDKCRYYNVPYYSLATSAEISMNIGKKRSICAFVDRGFADSFLKLVDTQTIEEREGRYE